MVKVELQNAIFALHNTVKHQRNAAKMVSILV